MATTVAFPAREQNGESPVGLESLAGAAKCARCDGLMVIEQGFDGMDSTGHVDFMARRCVQCGEVIDPVILQNRRLQFRNSFSPGLK